MIANAITELATKQIEASSSIANAFSEMSKAINHPQPAAQSDIENCLGAVETKLQKLETMEKKLNNLIEILTKGKNDNDGTNNN